MSILRLYLPMTVRRGQRQDSPRPHARCQWLLVSSPALVWQAGTGANKANRPGDSGDHTGRGRPTLPGAERYTPGATCAAASPRGHGRLPGETEAGLSGSANHEPPTPPSDRGLASPRPRTLPEPPLSATTRCPGGGERTRPSLGPCFPFSPSPCHARPLATVTLRGAEPEGRLRQHLRRQCVLSPAPSSHAPSAAAGTRCKF